jgi:hypothetical protein
VLRGAKLENATLPVVGTALTRLTLKAARTTAFGATFHGRTPISTGWRLLRTFAAVPLLR